MLMDSMNDFNLSLGKQVMDFCRGHHLGKDAFLEILHKAKGKTLRHEVPFEPASGLPELSQMRSRIS